MKLSHLGGLSLALLSLGSPALAQQPDWLTRCYREVGDSNAPETATYSYETRGKVATPARAMLDYTANGSPAGAVYLTEAKNLMNPHVGASLSLGYFVPVDGAVPTGLTLGRISVNALAKESKPIPGAPVKVKFVIDGATFGPYESRDSSRGSYSVWFDTADTDGDGKPPVLNPADFASLVKAVDAMETLDIILIQNETDIVRLPIRTPQHALVRDQLTSWAIDTRRHVGSGCGVSNTMVN